MLCTHVLSVCVKDLDNLPWFWTILICEPIWPLLRSSKCHHQKNRWWIALTVPAGNFEAALPPQAVFLRIKEGSILRESFWFSVFDMWEYIDEVIAHLGRLRGQISRKVNTENSLNLSHFDWPCQIIQREWEWECLTLWEFLLFPGSYLEKLFSWSRFLSFYHPCSIFSEYSHIYWKLGKATH